MKEPGPPVDLAIVFDTSTSMTGTPLANEKAAALSLISNMTNDSRVAIFRLASNIPDPKLLDFTLLDTAGRAAVTAMITGASLDTRGWTPLWQTIGLAIEYVITFKSLDRVPAVVALCDGQDYQGSDASIVPAFPADSNQLEMASDDNPDYAPWWDWSTTQITNWHIGKYFGKAATQGYWFNQSLTNAQGNRKGLLNVPIPVFTIGINLEHDANLPAFSSTSVADNVVNEAQNGFSVYTGAGSQESGTPEYNLYRIATTSPKGMYFYAPSSLDLFGVFEKVGQQLSSLVLARSARSNSDEMGPEAPASEEPSAVQSDAGPEGASSARSPNIPGANDLYALTQSFNLQGVSSARLSFWHKYSITMGLSGAVILVGTSADNTTFTYKYVTPGQSYKGNLKTSVTRNDDLGREIRWAWNGISGKGAFAWEYAEVNLNEFCNQQYVRVMFAYLRAGGGGGLGWWLDDIEVKVSRSNSVAVTNSSMDQWELVQKGAVLGSGGDNADAYSGNYAWLCHNPSASVDYLKGGLDNALITVPIDLTSALDATLIAKFKFNLNYTDGRPPDGFRVEVSSDVGVSWRPVHFGVRAAWKVSGTEAAGGDGKSFTGVDIGGNWVNSTSLTRLNCDLSGWAGSVIQLRFRVVTRADSVNHYHSVTGWGGFYIDDVTVFGNTTTGARSAPAAGQADDPVVGPDLPAPEPAGQALAGGLPEELSAGEPMRYAGRLNTDRPLMMLVSRTERVAMVNQRGEEQ